MKKITAISLLVLFLFNLVGYQAFFYFAQKQADTHLEASLDNNNYNEQDLITIKVPLLMPYQTSSSSFERVNGEVSFNGKIYKYVKRKITNGEMVLLCLPDEHKMHLQSAREEYFKFSNDIQNSASKKSGSANTHVFKSSLSDFDQQHSNDILQAFAINKPTHKIPTDISSLITRSHSSPEQPPEATANV